MNTKNNSLQYGTIYKADNSQFRYNNTGFRGGLSYIDDLGNDISMIGVPMSLVWRSRIDRRSGKQRLESSAYSLVSSEGNIPSALLGLAPLRVELSAGLTPMFVTNRGRTSYGWSSDGGDYSEILRHKNSLALSADLGARLSIRIWRINLIYHYWLTDGFEYKIIRSTATTSKHLDRSYFSLVLGVNFIL